MLASLIPIAALLGFVAAGPVTPATIADSSFEIVYNSTELVPKVFTQDEIHQNVLAALPADLVITSDQLGKYFGDHEDASFLIYLSDTRSWISTYGKNNSKALTSREPCSGNYYNVYKILAAQSFWGPWDPVSTCFYNTYDSNPNTQSLSYSESISITENIGISSATVAGIISGSVGFSVTESWSTTNTYTCTAPAGGISQVWARHYMGWSGIQVDQYDCSVFQDSYNGWGLAPQSSSSSFGCSTNIYVDCNNW